MSRQKWMVSFSTTALVSILAGPAFADCTELPTWQGLRDATISAVGNPANGGLGFNMWATVVATDGSVCAVAFSGQSYTDQWLGSRVISAQKANTANAFSLGTGSTPGTSLFGTRGLALSTANLYTAVQPGGSLYGLQHSNPVDTESAYGNQPPPSNSNSQHGPNNAQDFGTPRDPMVGQRVGGVNVFGGGLALYKNGRRVGGLGVSGDTSCTDHMVAWRVRNTLGLDQFGGPSGVVGVSGDAQRPDNIIFDIIPNGGIPTNDGGTGQAPSGTGGVGQSASGFGHPKCLNNPVPTTLPPVH
jgi:Haem degrading protein HbpS-like